MKEKFRYRIKHYRTVLIIHCLLCCFVLPPLLVCEFLVNDAVVAFIIFMAFLIISTCVVFYLPDNVPSRFRADRNFVEFRIVFKKINIRYSNIKSIEVTHEYAKPQINGDVGGYKEIIKFVCRNREYQFENIMDIDFDQTAADPENLSEQFERGKFMRLKNYISKQTGVTY